MELIRLPAPIGGTYTAYPYSLAQGEATDFDLWASVGVPLLDPNDIGMYIGSADTDAYGSLWAVFPGTTAPSHWDEATHEWKSPDPDPFPTFLVESERSYTLLVRYPSRETDPVLSIKRNGASVDTLILSGTGSVFTAEVTIPASLLQDVITVETQEGKPRIVFYGLVIEAVEELILEESSNRFNVKFIIRDVNTAIVPSALVYVTREPDASARVLRRGYTNSAGQIEFDLVPGHYYLWRNRDDFEFDDPVEFEVDEDGSVILS